MVYSLKTNPCKRKEEKKNHEQIYTLNKQDWLVGNDERIEKDQEST